MQCFCYLHYPHHTIQKERGREGGEGGDEEEERGERRKGEEERLHFLNTEPWASAGITQVIQRRGPRVSNGREGSLHK